MKGLAASALEALAAARALGCEAEVYEDIGKTLEQADAALLSRLVEGTHTHAARRADEMRATYELALAVEIAAREGARIVWLPTVDAENESPSRRPADPQGKRPVWAALQEDLQRTGVPWEPVRVVDGNGKPLPQLREVLRVVARHQMVLATGHLSRDEIFTVVEEAKAAGVQCVVVTHPDFPTQRLSVEDQRRLARAGAWLERCFGSAHSGKISWEELAEIIRAVGAAHSFLSSDLRQVHVPPVEDGLPLLADRLLALGFQEEPIRAMVENTVRIARLEGQR